MQRIDLIESALYDVLPYRKILEITKPFGLEIEGGLQDYEDRYFIVNKELIECGYKRETDSTVKLGFPMEIVSPLLYNSEETWNVLWLLSERMKKCDIRFDYAAFQVNVDVSYDEWDLYHFLLIFRSFEHIIFKFSTSGHTYLRSQQYAHSLGIRSIRKFNKDAIDDLTYNKKYAIALKYKENTDNGELPNIVEFRIPNGCDDAWMWQNYVNTFFYLTDVIPKLDSGYIDYIDYSLCYGETKDKPYSVLFLDDALVFADLIFKEDVDKIYFLKQYIGNNKKEAGEYVKRRKLSGNYGVN